LSGWIGVDLDGTLAVYDRTLPYTGGIGEPVPAMLARVKDWLSRGIEVRIFTARVGEPQQKWEGYEHSIMADGIAEQRSLIEAWCEKHIGVCLPVTATKDFGMIELYDDRCVRVEINTGRLIGQP
jgi:hypothetical protein